MADDMSDEEITTIANPVVVDKYKNAATVTNAALAYVASLCQPGASVLAICKAGDEYIIEQTSKLYAKKKNFYVVFLFQHVYHLTMLHVIFHH